MPKPGNPSIFAGGWTAEKQKILDSTILPEKLRCKQCTKLKSLPAFSQRQLGVLKQSLARNPRLAEEGTASVICRQCTEGQVMELECTQCGLVKSLEGFTKAQRRDPDFARCILCVNTHLEQPTAADDTAELREHGEDADDDTSEEEEGSDLNSNPYASDDDLSGVQVGESSSAIAGRTQQLTVDDNESEHGSIESRAHDGPSNYGSTYGATSRTGKDERGSSWREYAKQHGRGTALSECEQDKAAIAFTGYDTSGKAHERIRSPSTTASSLPDVAPRSNFARVKAYKPKPSKSSKFGKPEAVVNKGTGTIVVSDTVHAAVGRQRDEHDSDSDSDFGCI